MFGHRRRGSGASRDKRGSRRGRGNATVCALTLPHLPALAVVITVPWCCRTAEQLIRELAEAPAPEPSPNASASSPDTAVWVRRSTTLIDGRPNQLADSWAPKPDRAAWKAVVGMPTNRDAIRPAANGEKYAYIT